MTVNSATVKTRYLHVNLKGMTPKFDYLLKIWDVLNDLDCVLEYVDYCFKSNQTLYPDYINGSSTAKIKNNYLDGVRIIREQIDKISLKLFRVLDKYMEHDMIQEIIDTRFMAIRKFNEQWENIINKADII